MEDFPNFASSSGNEVQHCYMSNANVYAVKVPFLVVSWSPFPLYINLGRSQV